MSIRSLDKEFFSSKATYVSHIIEHYRLGKLVYCDHDINIDLLSEFFNNLQPTEDRLVYTTRVAKTNISFTPEIWMRFLGCRASTSTLECYPSLPDPLEGYDLNAIHEAFFRSPRNPGVNLVSAMGLSAPDNILYKVIVGCILPIVTRGQAKVRPHHLLVLHLLKNHLDFNIALNMFQCIVHFSVPVKNKVYMPLGHIITAWLESIGIRTDRGEVRPVKPLDYITWRNFSLAGMIQTSRGEIIWKEPQAQDQIEGEEPAIPADNQTAILEQLRQIRESQIQTDLKVTQLQNTLNLIQKTQDSIRRDQDVILRELVMKGLPDSDEPSSSEEPSSPTPKA